MFFLRVCLCVKRMTIMISVCMFLIKLHGIALNARILCKEEVTSLVKKCCPLLGYQITRIWQKKKRFGGESVQILFLCTVFWAAKFKLRKHKNNFWKMMKGKKNIWHPHPHPGLPRGHLSEPLWRHHAKKRHLQKNWQPGNWHYSKKSPHFKIDC